MTVMSHIVIVIVAGGCDGYAEIVDGSSKAETLTLKLTGGLGWL